MKTTLPPPLETGEAPLEGRSPSAPRRIVTPTQKLLLENMQEHGPQFPKDLLRVKPLKALEEKGLCVELPDGSFEIAEAGTSILNRKLGRPPYVSKMGGVWSMLVDHYGGLTKFASEVGCNPNTVTHWIQGKHECTGASRKTVERLAKEAKLQDPFTQTGTWK